MTNLPTLKIKSLLILFTFSILCLTNNYATAATYTWIGNTSDWNTATNWSPNGVPSSDVVIINAVNSPKVYPTITSGQTVYAYDLTIAATATVNMTGGTFNVYHDWKNSGTFNGTGGTVTIAGSGGSAATWAAGTNQLYNLQINSGFNPKFDNVANSTLRIAGNYTDNNTGTLSVSNAYTIIFNGSTAQSITTSRGANNSFSNLTISNTSAAVTLANTILMNGSLTVNARSQLALSTYNLGSPSSVIVECGASTGATISGTGTLTLGGNITVNDATGAGTAAATISCPVALGANRTITVADDSTSSSATDLSISGIISGGFGITKAGAGTIALSADNSYTGVTTINAGILSVAKIGNGGVAGNLGQATNVAGNIVLGGGTLRYTGSTASTNRAFTLTAATTSSIDVTTNTLTISGSGANTTGGLNKTGTGTLILSGNNAYTGATTISAGILQLGNSERIANTSRIVFNGGTLSTGTTTGYTETVSTLDLQTSNSTLTLGTGLHTVTFAASNAVSWASGKTLTIKGWTGNYTTGVATGGQVYVGTTAAGLTSTQLEQLFFYDGTNTYPGRISASGEILPNPLPTNLSYTTPNTFTRATAITSLSPTVTGRVTSYSISPALPSGLSFNTSTGVISGTPSIPSSATIYTVTASNSNSSATANLTITVNSAVLSMQSALNGGLWSNPNSWSGGIVPIAGDIVTITDNDTITVDIATAACDSLLIGGAGPDKRGGLTFTTSGSPKLTVSGTVTVGGRGSSNMNRNGSITFTSGSTLEAGSVILTQSFNNEENRNNPGTITMTAGGLLKTGSFQVGLGTATWVPGTGTVEMTATNTLPGKVFTSFNNLTISSGTTTTGVALSSIAALSVKKASVFSLAHTVSTTSIAMEAGAVSTGASIAGTSLLSVGGDITVTNNGGGTAGASISSPISLTNLNTSTFIVESAGAATPDLTVSGTVSVSGSLVKTGSGLLAFGSNPFSVKALTISAGSLKAPSANLSLSGDFTNNGTFTHNNGTITFNGSIRQDISGANAPVFYNLILNTTNSSDKISLNNSPSVQNALTMTKGNIYTGANLIALGISTTSLGRLNYTSGYVVGKMRRWFNGTNSGNTTGLFPVGEEVMGSLKNRHYLIEFSSAPTAGGYLDVNFMNERMSFIGLPIPGIPNTCVSGTTFDITSTADQGYWIAIPQSGTIGLSGSYTLSLTGQDFITVTDLCQLTLLKRFDGGSWTTAGTHLAPRGSIAMATVSRSLLSGFSNFGFGGGTPNVLPVELTYFNGVCTDGNPNIRWSTASELNSKEFAVERSENGIEFETVATLTAAGTSTAIHNYTYSDKEAKDEKTYYRLKTIDWDGSFEYSSIIAVSCSSGESKEIIHIYSSSSQEIGLHAQLSASDIYTIHVFDMNGSLVFSENKKLEKGSTSCKLYTNKKIPNAVCIVRVMNSQGESIISKKVWMPKGL